MHMRKSFKTVPFRKTQLQKIPEHEDHGSLPDGNYFCHFYLLAREVQDCTLGFLLPVRPDQVLWTRNECNSYFRFLDHLYSPELQVK